MCVVDPPRKGLEAALLDVLCHPESIPLQPEKQSGKQPGTSDDGGETRSHKWSARLPAEGGFEQDDSLGQEEYLLLQGSLRKKDEPMQAGNAAAVGILKQEGILEQEGSLGRQGRGAAEENLKQEGMLKHEGILGQQGQGAAEGILKQEEHLEQEDMLIQEQVATEGNPQQVGEPATREMNESEGGIAEQDARSLERLIYLSCGFPAFERDCTALLKSGAWKLHSVRAFSFFPGTDSLETLAVFVRT